MGNLTPVEQHRISQAKYSKTGKGKLVAKKSQATHRQTRKGKITRKKANAKWDGSEKGRASRARSRIRNVEKISARNMVNHAIRDGELFRPEFCSVSGCDGKGVEGHHEDYSKPLEVIWLCRVCHGLRVN